MRRECEKSQSNSIRNERRAFIIDLTDIKEKTRLWRGLSGLECLLCKPVESQNPHEKLCMATCACKHCWDRDRQILGDH